MKNAISEVSPDIAWDRLKPGGDAVLVDVRTKAEWSFVGVPDLSSLGKSPILLEWMTFPGMSLNESFAVDLQEQLGGAAPSEILFICRSGQRSMQAAQTTAMAFAAKGQKVECVNVAEGFEGDLNSKAHRGNNNGWKARGLSWRQS
ncbi:MAG: rhodanese-like domain-containing protein [Rhodobacteraceae bacterium]|nr:rhodanese-like domain-containing protein [Paracoccaceae bacterium]